MQIETTRFGTIEIDEGKSIEFPEGLVGFPDARRFVLLEHAPQSPFHWLQSMDEPDLAFVVVDPLLIDPQYADAVPVEAWNDLGPAGVEPLLLALVTIDRHEGRVTVNLVGPLVIHPETRKGRQLVLDESSYSIQHDIMCSTKSPTQVLSRSS
jgi:flagellar assembly factor FliW